MEISFTDQAAETIVHMRDKVAEVGLEFGETSPEYLKSLESFANAMATIARLKGRVMKDGSWSDLSLVCSSEYIVYGVVYDDKNSTWSVHS